MRQLAIALLAASCCFASIAQDDATAADQASRLIITSDEVFMDMALTASQTAMSRGLKPCGAVVIIDGAWRSTGMATADGVTAEENAIDKSHRTQLDGAVIYTVNHPTAAALNAISQSGVRRVYYVNEIDAVVAAGVYPRSAFSDTAADSTTLIQMDYAPAQGLINR
jgi:tRNA(Arg) A34 adenosine deaminase TadA